MAMSPPLVLDGFQKCVGADVTALTRLFAIAARRDAMETCSTLSGEAKDACYMLFGCDPRGVEQYLTVVETLESALQQEPGRLGEGPRGREGACPMQCKSPPTAQAQAEERGRPAEGLHGVWSSSQQSKLAQRLQQLTAKQVVGHQTPSC